MGTTTAGATVRQWLSGTTASASFGKSSSTATIKSDQAAVFYALEHWPTPDKLKAEFLPMHWNRFARNPKEYAARPSLYLADLPAVYGRPRDKNNPNNDLDVQVVAANITGIVALCGASATFKTDDIFMQASILAGRYGKTCTLNAVIVYFATYMTDWKSQYTSAYDPRDILQQFPNFLKLWQGYEHDVDTAANVSKVERPEPYTGKKALGIYYRGLLSRGFREEDILAFEGGRQSEESMRSALANCTYDEYTDCYNKDKRFRCILDKVTDRIREIQINAL